jgi:tetratricopeptide (TPR) repeat protein
VSDRLTRTSERSSHREMKEDVLVTGAFRASDWVQRNLRVVGIALGVVVVAGLASIWIGRAQAKAEGEANRILAEASANYWQGGYNRTIQLADQVLSDYKTTKAANDARRMKADALFWTGSFDSASVLYQEYLDKDKADTPVRHAVQQSLAFSLESKKDFPAAAKMFEQLAPTAPDRASTADFLMSAARAYRNANQPDKAKALYEKVANEYKDTSFARDAEVELGELAAAQPTAK